MPLEIEVRFRIPSELIRDRLMSDPLVTQMMMRGFKAVNMTAEYYDSPGHALQSLKSTLRRRTEDGVSRVSFKTQAQKRLGGVNVLAREKWECEADDVSIAIVVLHDMGAPSSLTEVAGSDGFLARGRFEFERLSTPLMLPDGAVVELNIDQGSMSAGDKREPMLELLLKLLYGEPSQLEELSVALEQKYELDRELCSKYERVLRLLRSRR